MSTINDLIERFTLIESGLHGSEIINRLQRGHVVRREAWIDGLYSRITNERGFDENGLAIFNNNDNIYTTGTHDLFTHIGFSGQHLREPNLYLDISFEKFSRTSRSGGGMTALFANDWEDYGFMSRDEFQEITKNFGKMAYNYWIDVVAQAAEVKTLAYLAEKKARESHHGV